MKNENVAKINTLGKISHVIVIIFRVVAIIALVACIICCAAAISVPSDAISVKGSAGGEIMIDRNKLPKNMFELDLDEANFDSKIFGASLKWIVDTTEEDGVIYYNIDADADNINGDHVKTAAIVASLGGILLSAFIIVVLHFGGNLTKALKKCDSPFSPEVLKAMKHFGYSLIPYGVVRLITYGITSLTTILIILVVLMFIFIFNYGAQLQQESDETL